MTDPIKCSCCHKPYERRQLHALGDEYICRRCGMWVALRLRPDQTDHDAEASPVT